MLRIDVARVHRSEVNSDDGLPRPNMSFPRCKCSLNVGATYRKSHHLSPRVLFGAVICRGLNNALLVVHSVAPPTALSAQFGRYVLLNLLGKGGFSEVWRAFDLVLAEDVAVKVNFPLVYLCLSYETAKWNWVVYTLKLQRAALLRFRMVTIVNARCVYVCVKKPTRRYCVNVVSLLNASYCPVRINWNLRSRIWNYPFILVFGFGLRDSRGRKSRVEDIEVVATARILSGAPAAQQLERATEGELHPTRHSRVRGKVKACISLRLPSLEGFSAAAVLSAEDSNVVSTFRLPSPGMLLGISGGQVSRCLVRTHHVLAIDKVFSSARPVFGDNAIAPGMLPTSSVLCDDYRNQRGVGLYVSSLRKFGVLGAGKNELHII